MHDEEETAERGRSGGGRSYDSDAPQPWVPAAVAAAMHQGGR